MRIKTLTRWGVQPKSSVLDIFFWFMQTRLPQKDLSINPYKVRFLHPKLLQNKKFAEHFLGTIDVNKIELCGQHAPEEEFRRCPDLRVQNSLWRDLRVTALAV